MTNVPVAGCEGDEGDHPRLISVPIGVGKKFPVCVSAQTDFGSLRIIAAPMSAERINTEWLIAVSCENCTERFVLLGDVSNGTSWLIPYTYVASCPYCHHSGKYHTSTVERIEHQISD